MPQRRAHACCDVEARPDCAKQVHTHGVTEKRIAEKTKRILIFLVPLSSKSTDTLAQTAKYVIYLG